MEQVAHDDLDLIMLHVKKKFSCEMMESKEEPGREQDFGMGFSICIPREFTQAEEETAAEIYWSQKRPSVVFLTQAQTAGITFQFLYEEPAGEDLFSSREKIRQITGQLDGRTVFYDMGEKKGATWFDYKSFAGSRTVYNMVFLFQAAEKKILGTFFCIFETYDKWRPKISGMIDTIRTRENEG